LYLFLKNRKTIQSADQIKKAILEDVRIFTAGYEQKDDMTVVVVKRS